MSEANRPRRGAALPFYLTAAFTLLLIALAHAPAARAQQWSTNGNDINNANSGNVGIGTTAPSAKLEVTANTAGNVVKITNSQSWTGTQYALNVSGYTNLNGFRVNGADGQNSLYLSGGQLGFTSDTGYPITFSQWTGAGGLERMRIDAATGNVGIGTAAPQERLHVNGGAVVTGPFVSPANVNGLFMGMQSTTDAEIAAVQQMVDFRNLHVSAKTFSVKTWNGGSLVQGLFQNTAGNVGIGTTSPGYKFDVQGGQLNASGGLCIAGECKTAWSQVGGGGSSQWTTTGNDISNTNSGNVGIGTATPYHRLEVSGPSAAIGFNPGNTSGFGANAVLNRIVARSNFGALDSSSAAEIRFLTGTNAWYKGQIAFFTNDYDSTASNAVERMRITNAGNVGIGTSAPGYRLDVIGGGSLSVDFRVNGRIQTGDAGGNGGVWLDGGQTMFVGQNGTNVAFWTSGGGFGGLQVTNAGKVGIGTDSPSTKLHVVGDVTVTGNIAAKYQDVAEWVPSSQKLSAGTVVVLDQERTNHVLASSESYDTRVAGVVSAQPGLILGEAGEGKLMVATTGRVKVKVDATRAPIKVGDLLVTGKVPGAAMRSEPVEVGGVRMHRPGTIIGKALEPLATGTGEILVLLSMQ